MQKQVIYFITLMAIFICHSSAHAFNNASFKGNYAYMLTGLSSIVLANEPNTVATGVLNADGSGGISGHGTFRSANIACDVQFSGTYTVNITGIGNINATTTTNTPGCTSGVLDLNIMLANNGHLINVASAENDYMCGTLTRQSKTRFSNADLSGKYALTLQGPSSIVNASQPYTAGVVLIESDGHGNVSGSAAFRSYGVSCTGTLEGGNRVTADGTGTINMNFTASSPWCSAVVVDLTLALISANSGVVANSENDLMFGIINRQIYK